MEIKQFVALAAAVVQQLPRDLDPTLAQRWIERQGDLRVVLRQALSPMPKPTASAALHRRDPLPTTMTVGGRTYELLGFLKGDEQRVVGYKMVDRAKEMQANLGEEDGQHILKHQAEIPAELRGKVFLVFTEWRRPDSSEDVACVDWSDDRWVQDWHWIGDGLWDGVGRVPHRIK